jgi:hypothetical protein
MHGRAVVPRVLEREPFLFLLGFDLTRVPLGRRLLGARSHANRDQSRENGSASMSALTRGWQWHPGLSGRNEQIVRKTMGQPLSSS